MESLPLLTPASSVESSLSDNQAAELADVPAAVPAAADE